MTFGFKTWNESGNVAVDGSKSIPRYLGQVDTGLANGSVTVAEFANGVPWTVTLPVPGTAQTPFPPVVTVSGTTLSWTFNDGVFDCLILYGTR